MPANVYECMFLLDPNKVAGDVPNAAKHLHTIFEKNHAEVLASRPWDERKLAYPVKNHKKGLYYLTYFRSEGQNLVNIERDLALTEMVLRQMMLYVDPKLVDIMLALARDEHALALHTVNEAAEAEEERMEDRRGPRGPRGPRRSDGDKE